MSLFENLFKSSYSKEDIQRKGMEGIINYQKRNFQEASKSFEQYFKMKINGKFPDLDKDDTIMLLNYGNAKQYSDDYRGAILTYETILISTPTWDAPYLMKSVCLYKLGEVENSKTQWELARKFGNDIAQNEFETSITKF